MAAVTADTLTLPRVKGASLGDVERPVLAVSTAPAGFEGETRKFLAYMRKRLDEYEGMIGANPIFIDRTRGIGIITPELSILKNTEQRGFASERGELRHQQLRDRRRSRTDGARTAGLARLATTPDRDDALTVDVYPASDCRTGKPVQHQPIDEQDAHGSSS